MTIVTPCTIYIVKYYNSCAITKVVGTPHWYRTFCDTGSRQTLQRITCNQDHARSCGVPGLAFCRTTSLPVLTAQRPSPAVDAAVGMPGHRSAAVRMHCYGHRVRVRERWAAWIVRDMTDDPRDPRTIKYILSPLAHARSIYSTHAAPSRHVAWVPRWSHPAAARSQHRRGMASD